MLLIFTLLFAFSLYLVIWTKQEYEIQNQILAALLEYAAILLLLKKRRKPLREIEKKMELNKPVSNIFIHLHEAWTDLESENEMSVHNYSKEYLLRYITTYYSRV